jgi:hypothetical protein
MEERHIELVWRCSSCQVQNLGRHVACTGCGNPKDDSEAYEMPADPAALASVTDPELLRLAMAGENWRCRYCQSHQRRLDGACASCGADSAEGGAVRDDTPGEPAIEEVSQPPRRVLSARRKLLIYAILAVGLALALLVLALPVLGVVHLVQRSGGPPVPLRRSLVAHVRVLDAPVAGRHWEHRIYVDRWKKVPHEGFAELRPNDAVDVVSLGQRQHHTERVLSGYRTESYQERVSDGSTTETYSATESCGQTCTSTPRTCRQVCTSSKNGFAKCRDDCSGGGQTCTTKTCSVTKTRSVPRFKDVTRTRQIPQYRDEPRFAPFFGWNLWQWVENRRFARAGTTEAPTWHAAEELLAKDKLGVGERERDRREASYSVTVTVAPSSPVEIRLETLADFDRASSASALPVWLTPAGDAGAFALP